MNAYGVGRRPGWGGLAAVTGWLAGVAAIVVAGAALAQAPNQIEQVSVTRAASGNTIVRFELKAPPANPPAGFATASPAQRSRRRRIRSRTYRSRAAHRATRSCASS